MLQHREHLILAPCSAHVISEHCRHKGLHHVREPKHQTHGTSATCTHNISILHAWYQHPEAYTHMSASCTHDFSIMHSGRQNISICIWFWYHAISSINTHRTLLHVATNIHKILSRDPVSYETTAPCIQESRNINICIWFWYHAIRTSAALIHTGPYCCNKHSQDSVSWPSLLREDSTMHFYRVKVQQSLLRAVLQLRLMYNYSTVCSRQRKWGCQRYEERGRKGKRGSETWRERGDRGSEIYWMREEGFAMRNVKNCAHTKGVPKLHQCFRTVRKQQTFIF